MRNLIPEIPEQVVLYSQLYKAMQGDIMVSLMKRWKGSTADRILHANMKNHSLQILPNILPDLYQICQEVKEKLEFDEPIDFYITGTSEVNACATYALDENKPHVIQLNSGLVNLMNEDELRFIIGHEIGHLKNKDGLLGELYQYIYPEPDDKDTIIPSFINRRYKIWHQLAEFSADRWGYMACENLTACVTAIFKMSSGLLLDKMNIQIIDLLDHNLHSLQYYLNENLQYGGTHPINPARIHALQLYAKAKTQKALAEGMEDLMNVVEGFFFSQIDEVIAVFFASAGLYMIKERGKNAMQEEDFILNKMADYCFSPVGLLKQVKKDDYAIIMHNTLDKIREDAPERIPELIKYLVDLAFVDNRIEPSELDQIYMIASDLDLTEDIILDVLTEKIQDEFEPQASLIR